MNDNAMSNVPKALQLLRGDEMKLQLQAAIPRSVAKWLTPDRMIRIATTEMRKSPDLKQCTAESVVGSIVQSAQLGLEPGSVLGHSYLVPFNSKYKDERGQEAWRKECQLIVGYRGMIDLARRSGQIEQINAWAVRDCDEFSYGLGLEPYINHTPDDSVDPKNDGSDIIFVYAIAKLKDGGVQFEVMSRAKVEAIRNRSKAKKFSPWQTDYEAMAKKTVVRQLFKMLPVSLEIQRAVGTDELADAGEQHADAYLDTEWEEVDPVEAAKEAMQKDPNAGYTKTANPQDDQPPMMSEEDPADAPFIMSRDQADALIAALPKYDLDSVNDVIADLAMVPKDRQKEVFKAAADRKNQLEGGVQEDI